MPPPMRTCGLPAVINASAVHPCMRWQRHPCMRWQRHPRAALCPLGLAASPVTACAPTSSRGTLPFGSRISHSGACAAAPPTHANSNPAAASSAHRHPHPHPFTTLPRRAPRSLEPVLRGAPVHHPLKARALCACLHAGHCGCTGRSVCTIKYHGPQWVQALRCGLRTETNQRRPRVHTLCGHVGLPPSPASPTIEASATLCFPTTATCM